MRLAAIVLCVIGCCATARAQSAAAALGDPRGSARPHLDVPVLTLDDASLADERAAVARRAHDVRHIIATHEDRTPEHVLLATGVGLVIAAGVPPLVYVAWALGELIAWLGGAPCRGSCSDLTNYGNVLETLLPAIISAGVVGVGLMLGSLIAHLDRESRQPELRSELCALQLRQRELAREQRRRLRDR